MNPETNPLIKFSQSQGTNPQPTAGVIPSGENPLIKFANQKQSPISMGSNSNAMNSLLGKDASYAPQTVDDARKLQQDNPTLWDRVSKNLMKPIGLVATAAEQTGKFAGDVASGNFLQAGKDIIDTPGKLGGIVTGSSTRSFTDLWQENFKSLGIDLKIPVPVPTLNLEPGIISQSPIGFRKGEVDAATAIGLVIDIAADPLNFIGGGLTKLGTLTEKVAALNKAKETLAVGSKLHNELKALGLADDISKLSLGATKAEQAAAGQRALLTVFGNTPWEKTLVGGARIYEKTGALKTAIGGAWNQTRPAQIISKVFNTKTSNEAFNLTKEHFDNLLSYRKGEVMDKALDIQKDVAKMTQEEAYKLLDVVEGYSRGVRSGVKEIDDLATKLTSNFNEMHKLESSLGLVKSTIQDYFPHIKATEKLTLTERLGKLFGNPQRYKTALGSSKERQIVKFVSEGGSETMIGKASGLGLKPINAEKLITRLTSDAGEQISKLQTLQKKLASGEIALGTEDLRATVAELRKHVSNITSTMSDEVIKADLGDYQSVISGLVKQERDRLTLLIDDLANSVKTSQGKEFLKGAVGGTGRMTTEAKLVDAQNKILKITNELTDQSRRFEFFDFTDKDGKLYKAIRNGGEYLNQGKAGVNEINKMFGTEFFESRPAVAFAQRALGSAKAVTSKEFFNSVKMFGKSVADDAPEAINWVETGLPELKGLKFSPDIADSLVAYNKSVKPEEINIALRGIDKVQNLWKAQALTAPSYHIRNLVGNLWNNFLAGVNPADPRAFKSYVEAGKLQAGQAVSFTDDAGRLWDNNLLMKSAKESGVINEGWFAKDIETALTSEMGGLSANPLKENFALYRANRAVGSVLENNARLAHFIEKLKSGQTIDNAAASVKKYLFDYGDLTTFEKNVFKRIAPFYTWTRKNIPLQLESMVKEPAKFAGISKVSKAVESQTPEPNEKYLGDYIKNNIGIRSGSDDKGNTYYFLLGNWLPAAQAIDFLSQPAENFTAAISPFIKTPIELWANQSFFFEDTFGTPSKLERYPEENQSFLGFTMRKKTAYILKNIRILNELDKLNPGSIFGDKDNPSLANRIAPEAGFRAPFGIGTITTSDKRKSGFTPETSQNSRVLQSMFGKLIPYNPQYSKKFYLWDTETKVREIERSIKDAKRDGQKEYAKRLTEELHKIKKTR